MDGVCRARLTYLNYYIKLCTKHYTPEKTEALVEKILEKYQKQYYEHKLTVSDKAWVDVVVCNI